jgi:hypothetical protein
LFRTAPTNGLSPPLVDALPVVIVENMVFGASCRLVLFVNSCLRVTGIE